MSTQDKIKGPGNCLFPKLSSPFSIPFPFPSSVASIISPTLSHSFPLSFPFYLFPSPSVTFPSPLSLFLLLLSLFHTLISLFHPLLSIFLSLLSFFLPILGAIFLRSCHRPYENERMRMQCLTCDQNRQEVYCEKRNKRLMEKTKKKTTEQSRLREGSPKDGMGSIMMGRISGKERV